MSNNHTMGAQIETLEARERLEVRHAELQKEAAELQDIATRMAGEREAGMKAEAGDTIQATSRDGRSKNPLRPATLSEVIGQDKAKRMMGRMIQASRQHGERLDHTLLIGPAGTGKTTFANVIANELDVDCFQISAPVSLDTLLDLRTVMNDGDMLFVDEIHMQAIQERRGKSASTEPEVFLQLLEDQVIATPEGMLSYPDITVVGATTDEGMLPDAFVARFPIRPRLEKYGEVDLARMAVWNAERLKLNINIDAALMFALAARGTPREINNFLKNARSLNGRAPIDEDVAAEVIYELNGLTHDGLTPDQQGMLIFLYTKGRRERGDGEVTYQASVSTIATAIGKSRDQRAVQLRVEPFLIENGYVQVGHGGRILTDAGVARAEQLLTEVGE